MDHSEGLADKGIATREIGSQGGFRRGGGKTIGLFAYDKTLDATGVRVSCEVRVFPLLVKRQSQTWPEIEQRVVQWAPPHKALTLIHDAGLKALVAAFVKRVAMAASKSTP